MMRWLRVGLLVILITIPVVISACGSVLAGAGHGQRVSPRGAEPQRDAAEIAVIRGWAQALRRGDVRAAARYFALPSVFANGVGSNGALAEVVIRTERQAQAVNESLPCGALLISTTRHGRYIEAAFRLTNRRGPGAGCGSGTGQSAATDFVITDGRIDQWIRAPASAGGAPPAVPTVPAGSPGSGSEV